MHHLQSRLWIAIAISTLIIGSTHSAIAQPPAKSATPRTNSRQRFGVTKRLSQTNLAKVGIESAMQPNLDRSSRRRVSKVRVTQPRQNRIDNGITQFTNPNSNPPRATDVEAVNNLIE